MKSNLVVLAAQKAQREQRRITMRTVALETGISQYTIYRIANNTITELPIATINKLLTYFDCDLGDLFLTEEVSEA